MQHEPAIKAALPALSHGELPSVDSLRKHLPDLKVRVMNVVDLMTLQPQSEYPNGLSGAESDMTVRHELDRFSLVRDVIDLREHGDEIPMVEDRT